jgi:hypothetical protein
MMGRGTYARILLGTTYLDGTFERLQASEATSSRSRPISLTGLATAPSAIQRAT